MTTTITCPACQAPLRLATAPTAGKRLRCPRCAELIRWPGEGDVVPVMAAPRRMSRAAPLPDDADDWEKDSRPRRRRPPAPAVTISSVVWVILGILSILALAGVLCMGLGLRFSEYSAPPRGKERGAGQLRSEPEASAIALRRAVADASGSNGTPTISD
jgi:hypothetical protein